MTIHDEDRYTAPVWGAPPPPPAELPPAGESGQGPTGSGKKKMSPMAKTLTAVGVAAVVAVGGTVAVTAANSSASSTQNGAAQSGGAQNGGGQGGPGGGGFGGGDGNGGRGFDGNSAVGALTTALHGQFVVSGTSGSTTTEQIQTGTVTAVSATSLSVKSTDGFTGSYVVGSVDVSTAAVGTSVTVLATVSGSTPNLVSARTSTTAANAAGANGNAGPAA